MAKQRIKAGMNPETTDANQSKTREIVFGILEDIRKNGDEAVHR